MRPRIAVAGFQHETNTFCPLPTRFADFETADMWPALTLGENIRSVFAGQNIPIAGFLAAPEAQGFACTPIVWASAEPAGYVADAAFDRIAGIITDALAQHGPFDGVYLDLHGAMVTESCPDGEGEILRRVRAAVGPGTPIAVSLDLHANISAEIVELADVLTIYRTYPHIDMAETGARTAKLLDAVLRAGRVPAKAWRRPDVIAPLSSQSTMREPARAFYRSVAAAAETEGVFSADAALGFPPTDIPDVGPAMAAFAWEQAAADAAADAMLAAFARLAHDPGFHHNLTPAADTVREAMRIAETASRPVVIADAQDNPGAGGVGDSTGLLRALLDAGAKGACLGVLWNPETSAQAHAAGEGAVFDARIGGIFPDIGGAAVACGVRVAALSDGEIDFTGPMYGGSHGSLGPMAALRVLNDAGGETGVTVVTASGRAQNADQECFRAAGIEPADMRIIAVKSTLHFLADYEPIAEAVLFAEAPGANICRVEAIPYTRLRAGVSRAPTRADA